MNLSRKLSHILLKDFSTWGCKTHSLSQFFFVFSGWIIIVTFPLLLLHIQLSAFTPLFLFPATTYTCTYRRSYTYRNSNKLRIRRKVQQRAAWRRRWRWWGSTSKEGKISFLFWILISTATTPIRRCFKIKLGHKASEIKVREKYSYESAIYLNGNLHNIKSCCWILMCINFYAQFQFIIIFEIEIWHYWNYDHQVTYLLTVVNSFVWIKNLEFIKLNYNHDTEW